MQRGRRAAYCSDRCRAMRNRIGAAYIRAKIYERTNASRRAHRLRRLWRDPLLDAVAQEHAVRMARTGVLSHGPPPPTQRALRMGYRYEKPGLGCVGIAENCWGMWGNVPINERTAGSAVRSWLGSPGHRQNMLDASHTRLGIGFAIPSRGGAFAVQEFT